MAMTKAQQQYAIGKLNTLANKKKNEITKQFGWVKESLTAVEKYEAIKEGRATLKEKFNCNSYNVSVKQYFDFDDEREAGISSEGTELIYRVDKALEEAVDEVMLGDAHEALELIKLFSERMQ